MYLNSTPSSPDSLFYNIEREKEKDCIYKRIRLDYTVGLKAGMFTQEEINKQRASPSFEREYNLKYLGTIGNLFLPEQIDTIVKLGEQLKNVPVMDKYNLMSCGCDFGFSTSSTAIVLLEHIKEKGKIIVRYSQEIEKGDPNYIADLLWGPSYQISEFILLC